MILFSLKSFQGRILRGTPVTDFTAFATQPPIFSGRSSINRTRSPLEYRPSAEYSVQSFIIPGGNLSGINLLGIK